MTAHEEMESYVTRTTVLMLAQKTFPHMALGRRGFIAGKACALTLEFLRSSEFIAPGKPEGEALKEKIVFYLNTVNEHYPFQEDRGEFKPGPIQFVPHQVDSSFAGNIVFMAVGIVIGIALTLAFGLG
jgi:hypothetical protein